MKLSRKSKVISEPPSAATGDIAFNLIVFFLVCASVQPDSGRKQDIPRSESKEKKEQQSQNIEVALNRNTAMINGQVTREAQFLARLSGMLKSKSRPEDRIVVVKSSKDTPYHHWIKYTGFIEQAGGIITLQLEEERTVMVE